MEFNTSSILEPETLAEPFDRLDSGDCSELRELDILIDLPEVVSVARIHFECGTGYEVIHSDLADVDDLADVVRVVSRATVVRVEPWGVNGSGHRQHRILYWERN